MRNITLHLFIFILFVCMCSCSKPDPQLPVGNQPQYFMQGIHIGQDSIKFIAGVKGQYMFPIWQRTEFASPDSIYQFIGTLAPAGCVSCPPSFSIAFADSDISTLAHGSYASSFLKVRAYPFLNPSVKKAGVKITYIDSTGKAYVSSKGSSQPLAAYCNVGFVEEGPASNGVATKKMRLKFSCRCYFSGTDFVDFKDVEASVLIGYH